MMHNTGPKDNVVSLLFHVGDDDGTAKTTYGGLLSTTDGHLLISNLSTGQSMSLDVTDIPTVTALLQAAVNRYVQENAPEVESIEVAGEPAEEFVPEPAAGAVDEKGMPVAEDPPAPAAPRRPVRRVDE